MPQQIQSHHALYKDLCAISGQDNVSDEEYVRRSYTRGPFMKIYGEPRGKIPGIIVRPGSTEEISAILQLANRTGFAVVPKGGGGSLSTFPPPHVGTDANILIDTTRMNKIVSLDKEYMTVTAECGIVLSQLAEEVRKEGFLLHTVDVPIHMDTLGGVLSGFIGGGEPADLATSGTMNKYLLGLKVVLPTGTIIQTGGGPGTNIYQSEVLHREAHSPDMTGMFVGDAGVFGIKTEATMHVLPYPKHSLNGAFDMGTVEIAWKAVSKAVSIEPYPYTRLMLLRRPGETTILLYVIRGHSSEEVNYKKKILEDVLSSFGGKPGGFGTAMEMGTLFSARQLGKAVLPIANTMTYFGESLIPRLLVPKWLEYLNKALDKRFSDLDMAVRCDFALPYLRQLSICGIMTYFGRKVPAEEITKRMKDYTDNEWHNELFSKYGGFTELAQGMGSMQAASVWSPSYKAYMQTIKHALDPNNILMPGLWRI